MSSATRSVTVVGGTASPPPAYDIGQRLRVYDDPNRPTWQIVAEWSANGWAAGRGAFT
jgi:hypothetical protein